MTYFQRFIEIFCVLGSTHHECQINSRIETNLDQRVICDFLWSQLNSWCDNDKLDGRHHAFKTPDIQDCDTVILYICPAVAPQAPGILKLNCYK